MPRDGQRWGFWAKAAMPPLAAIASLLLLRLVTHGAVDQARLSGWLAPFGELAPLVFVLVLAVRPLTLLPGALFTAAGGLLFGSLWGTVYALVGSFLSSVLIFVLARPLGGRLMRRAAGVHYPLVRELAETHGFEFALTSCLNPLIPTDVAQVVAAASGARFWGVALGVLVGTLPGTFLTAAFGSALGQGKAVLTAVFALGMLLSLIAGAWLGKRALATYRRARDERARRVLRMRRAIG